MSEHIQKTIAELQTKIAEEAEATRQKKKVVNDLCAMVGIPPVYSDVNEPNKMSIANIRGDQFYGRGLSTCVREYLEARKAANLGPANIYEIYDALKAGGYETEGADEDARRGIAISLAKNTSIFHRLPNSDKIGLLSWYPNAKAKKAENADSAAEGKRPEKPAKANDAGKAAKTEAKQETVVADLVK